MANTGDIFEVELNRPQLEWGTFRRTDSRGHRHHEGYLKIPKHIARNLLLFNTNHTHGEDVWAKIFLMPLQLMDFSRVRFVQKDVLTQVILMPNSLLATKISWLSVTGMHKSMRKLVILSELPLLPQQI